MNDQRICILKIEFEMKSILIIIIPYIAYFTNYIFHYYGMLIGLGYLSFIFIITWIVTKKQPLGYGDLQLILILGLWLGPLKILLTLI